jgi:hypothetical protein
MQILPDAAVSSAAVLFPVSDLGPGREHPTLLGSVHHTIASMYGSYDSYSYFQVLL